MVIGLAPCSWTASAGEHRFISGEHTTPLLELYTSQGCNSCPPADQWVSRLADHPGLWRDFVPVAFHVTYWNYLGWRDAFAQSKFDQRQRRRAGLAASGVYTPGVFLNNAEFRGWRRMRADNDIANTAQNLAPGAHAPGVLQVIVTDDQVNAQFHPRTQHRSLSVEMALLGNGLSTQVRAGENRGKTLSHNFVALHLLTESMFQSKDRWHTTFDLTQLPSSQHSALAIWVTDASGNTLQATGGSLDR